MRFLGKRLDIAVIVDAREQKRRDRVFFGATVTVEDEEGEKIRTAQVEDQTVAFDELTKQLSLPPFSKTIKELE
jgi:transcription elongation GreA/GreB family factor